MINIGSIINRELADRESIRLPGLGTLKKEYVPAYFDESQQLFIPPAQALVFVDQQLDQDVLTEFLAGEQDLSLTESKKMSSTIIQLLEDCLKGNEDAYIAGIGTCSVNQNGELVLITEPDKSAFGMYEPIAEAELHYSQAAQTEEQFPEADQVALTQDSSTAEDELSAEEPLIATESDDLEQENSSKRWIWPVIGVALCVLIAGVWYLVPLQQQSATQQQSAQSVSETGTDSDSANPVAAPTTGAVTTAANTASSLPSDPEPMIKAPSARYEIIIAAFETMAEAEEYVTKTNAKGYNVYILQNNRAGNMNKISYASFNNAADASESLTKIRKELASEAWLWENKNYHTNNQN